MMDRPSARSPVGSAVAGLAIALLATGLSIYNLAARPSCPAGYTRLIDLEPLLPWLAGLLALAQAITAFATRKNERSAQRLGAIILVVTLPVLLLIGWYSLSDQRGYAEGCWTF